MFVWCPSKLPSRVTSRHHKNIQQTRQKSPKKVVSIPKRKPWKYRTPPIVKVIAEIDVRRGIALKSTKWKAWRWEKKGNSLYIKNKKRR